MFSTSGLMAATTLPSGPRRFIRHQTSNLKLKKSKGAKKVTRNPSICIGSALHLQERTDSLNPYGYSCSLRCRHPMHIKSRRTSSQGKTDDWIPEDLYKRYTETDSRPASPDNFSRRSVSIPRGHSISGDYRKCLTPEPDAKQCQFHQRRVLILDLRRVKSVDVITRQNSLTTGTSIDSTYGDDDRSSSANRDSSSMLHMSPRNLSLSRSTTPKAKARGRKKKSKERSSSPVAYERSSSPKILEGLTLPPLHSSVLTLLGQKAQMKSSPRNPITQQDPILNAGGTKHKKLRRHGRNRRKSECKTKGEANKSGNVDEKEDGKNTQDNADDPNETQMSTMTQNDGHDGDPQADPNLKSRKENEHIYTELKSPLYKILDGKMISSQWNPEILSNLDVEINNLHENLKKYETKFKSSNISMKEDLWLSFPRTWSRGSASFGIPNNPKSLKSMEPREYLSKYVKISESRIHLYNLVFHRHRTIENPTLKDISFKAVMCGISEVLGRNFTEKELQELTFHFMGLDSLDGKVDEFLFRGICAFCERVYGSHSLEDCEECHKCSKSYTKDKSRCHWNQQSHLERADFAYISTKIRNNEIQTNLSYLLRAVCEKKEDAGNANIVAK